MGVSFCKSMMRFVIGITWVTLAGFWFNFIVEDKAESGEQPTQVEESEQVSTENLKFMEDSKESNK